MILRPLSFEEISKIFDDQAQSVIQYFLFKAIISQPELVTGQNKLPIQIPKEHIEQWGVQSLGLESIGAGSYPIDLVAKDKSFGADIKMLSWNGGNKMSGETSLGQKFENSELDMLFDTRQFEKIINTWKEILNTKFKNAFKRYNQLKKIYYFIFIREFKKFHICAMEVNTKNFNIMKLSKSSAKSVWVDNFLEKDYGQIKIYKSKKRMELRLKPKKWISKKHTISFNMENLPSISRDIKILSTRDRYDSYLDDVKKIYKSCCNYES